GQLVLVDVVAEALVIALVRRDGALLDPLVESGLRLAGETGRNHPPTLRQWVSSARDRRGGSRATPAPRADGASPRARGRSGRTGTRPEAATARRTSRHPRSPPRAGRHPTRRTRRSSKR